MRLNIIGVMTIIIGAFETPVALAVTEFEERAMIRDGAADAYVRGDFSRLEALHTKYSDFAVQRTASGAFKISLFFDGINQATKNASEKELSGDIERTKKWADEYKNVPLVYVLHARALLEYGSYFRGGGFASTVPPQAWKTYNDYTQRAAKFLIESESIASKSTSWHAWMLDVIRMGGLPQEAAYKVFYAGIDVDATDYRLYAEMTDYLLPKWHGSAEQIDGFIKMAADRAPAEYKKEIYARLYSRVGENYFGRRMYSTSLVDWARMKAGLEAWNEKFPTQWSKNIFAYHACMAGDKKLAIRLLGEIGDMPEWEIWKPRPQATFETCVRWAGDPKAEPLEPQPRLERSPLGAPS